MVFDSEFVFLVEGEKGDIFRFDIDGVVIGMIGPFDVDSYGLKQIELNFGKVINEYKRARSVRACIERMSLSDAPKITLYNGKRQTKCVLWEQYWLYRCTRLKQSFVGQNHISDSDFTPCAMTFGEIAEVLRPGILQKGKFSLEMEYAGFEIHARFTYRDRKELERKFLG